MKKIYFLFSFLILTASTMLAQTSCVLQLTNVKTGKKINICTKIDPDRVEAILGKAITLDKEIQEKNGPPIFNFTYDGLTMTMQDDQFKNVTITNKKWKLNNITIGTLFEEVEIKHEQIKKIYFADYKFKIKDSNGFLFIDVDNLKNVKRLGVEF
ncbi:hypothetical protein [Flavobacterium columnare]|uniref:Beta-lactamase-inhibitor-like PepSY-like domain-containing protein n=1 Tax=Flavobacterium columnare (strain ATCC 49512 / CIP 103533 / TG 44/87) TaxID=1041826 RepID=G8XAR4_FLACA|nr:hypothetical protein [Flavobacterium columnare]AEW87370.1 hypothetical protein FCOL_12875 [Flavobacterium columnare ATCC 49512]